MKTATKDDLRRWEPCRHPEETDAYLADKPDTFTALDVLRWERLSVQDAFWVVLRSELIDERILRRFADWCADQARGAVGKPDRAGLLDGLAMGMDDEFAERRAATHAACVVGFVAFSRKEDAPKAKLEAREAQKTKLIEMLEEPKP